MKVLIFGTGKFFSNRKNDIKDEIVAFIDNKVTAPTMFEDKELLHPTQWGNVEFDIILLMSVYQKDMKAQLLELGVAEESIWTWEEYSCRPCPGRIDLYLHDITHGRRKILVFTESLYYNGGSMTAIYAVIALKKKGYDVWLAGGSLNVDESFLSEVGQLNINIAVIYDCPFLLKSDLWWIGQFDVVIVNVFQMLKCACDISRVRPVLWWLHEPNVTYGGILTRFPEYNDAGKLKNMHIVAVSDVAKECFNSHFPDVNCTSMVYGIPDESFLPLEVVKRINFVFAIIGYTSPIKGQDIFLKAVKLLEHDGFENIEFWIIGTVKDNDYSKNVYSMAQEISHVKIFGNLNRKHLNKAFDEIDVVVSTSREDTMSIVLTEGMMHGKVCISSDSTGMAKYIHDGENGFVFESENVEAVYEKMKWVLLHRDELSDIRRRARDTYEKYFSMEAFGERLEKELIQTENRFSSLEED